MNNIQISENFQLIEFEDTRTGEVRLDKRLLRVMQTIRTSINKPIRITSGYRTKNTHMQIYKEKYGNAWEDKITWGSKHLLGQAVDFYIINGTSDDYKKAIKIAIDSNIIKGIGNGLNNGGFLHMDCRSSAKIISWSY